MDTPRKVEVEPVKPVVLPPKAEPMKVEPKVEFKPQGETPVVTPPQVKPVSDVKH